MDIKIDTEVGSRFSQRQGGGNLSFHLTTHQHQPTKFTGRSDVMKGLILDTGGNSASDHA